MAKKIEDKQTVRVEVSKQELTKILIQPAKDMGLIDFDPTRVGIDEQRGGGYVVTFEKVAAA